MKTMFLSAIPAAVVLAFVTFSAEGQTTSVASPVSGVAYVSSNRLLTEVVSARNELSRVQAMQQQKNNEIRAKQAAIDATRKEFSTAADTDARTRLLKQEQDQREDMARAMQQAQTDIQRLQRDVQAEVQAQVRAAISEIAAKQNLKLVINQDTSVVWSAPGMDITSLVVEKLNAPPAAKP